MLIKSLSVEPRATAEGAVVDGAAGPVDVASVVAGVELGAPVLTEEGPGHAGNEGPQLARTGASQGFPRAAAPVGVC